VLSSFHVWCWGQDAASEARYCRSANVVGNPLDKMRLLTILIIAFGCGPRQTETLDSATLTDNRNSDLYVLLNQLPVLKTPLTFNSNGQTTRVNLVVVNNDLTNRISEFLPDFHALGKIYQTDEFIAVISIVHADIATPVLTTYDKDGKEIDSFFFYPTAGGDMGYYSKNIITLNDNRVIVLTDSTLTRKINEEGSNEIPGTDSLSVTTKQFRLNDRGAIEETR
jgi:hypothetical protein